MPKSIRETFHEWVGKQLLLVSANNTNSTDKNKNAMICFDQLLVPAWSLFRFPLFSNKQVMSLRKYTFLWRHMRTHDFNDQWNWPFPVPALQAVQLAVQTSLGLPTEQWVQNINDTTTKHKHATSIFKPVYTFPLQMQMG